METENSHKAKPEAGCAKIPVQCLVMPDGSDFDVEVFVETAVDISASWNNDLNTVIDHMLIALNLGDDDRKQCFLAIHERLWEIRETVIYQISRPGRRS